MLTNYSGVLGRVGQIYQKGFDLIRGDESIIHFRGETWLHSPFGAVLDQPIPKWVKDVALREGDIFERKVRLLQRRTRNGCSIQMNPSFIVDLKRTLCIRPPQRETLLSEIQLLSEEIFKWSRFEGMAGVLALLAEELPSLPFISSIPISFWSSHALRDRPVGIVIYQQTRRRFAVASATPETLTLWTRLTAGSGEPTPSPTLDTPQKRTNRTVSE